MMKLSEIAKVLNVPMRGIDVNVRSIGTDSRNIAKGQLFVGIKGEHFDGNSYAAEALKQGAAAVMISSEKIPANPSVKVEDTRLALGTLAHYWRNKFDLPLVAVTGSNGKTTVKEMISAILNAAEGKVLATRGNLNNDIGVPLSLFGINNRHSFAVIEMGMNHEGEIRYLSKLACPQVAVINNAGTAHIGELGSREAIARAKGEIFEGLAEDGIAVINADDAFADYWKSLNKNRKVMTFGLDANADISAIYKMQDNVSQIRLKTPNGSIKFDLKLLGEHNVRNALAASAAACALGVNNENIAKGLAQCNPVKGRLHWLEGANGAMVIDDTYNANPDSMKMAIDVLANQKGAKTSSLIFVMGDMAELGDDSEQFHAEIGAYAKKKGIHQLLSYGEFSKLASEKFGVNGKHLNSLEGLLEKLRVEMSLGVTVLVKGSRYMKMERVVNAIVKEKSFLEAH
ncbi:MAG: UDP-N-acetylmuramoyl-tripeptide--D-alanyl-D-alanine ligase [Methylophilaceae bacterium]